MSQKGHELPVVPADRHSSIPSASGPVHKKLNGRAGHVRFPLDLLRTLLRVRPGQACHKPTHAPQRKAVLLDDLVGAEHDRLGKLKSECLCRL